MLKDRKYESKGVNIEVIYLNYEVDGIGERKNAQLKHWKKINENIFKKERERVKISRGTEFFDYDTNHKYVYQDNQITSILVFNQKVNRLNIYICINTIRRPMLLETLNNCLVHTKEGATSYQTLLSYNITF